MTDILVVDDSAFDHAFVKQMFRRIGRIRAWNAEYVTGGEAALDRLQERRFDLILTDLHMPKMNGLQLLDKIQFLDIDIPVVIMTSNGSEQLVLDALRGGAANYVIKKNLEIDLPKIIEKMNWTPGVNGKTRLY
jgi:CheY-like chemotaxis protein